MTNDVKGESNNISGKGLAKLLGVDPRDYRILYPNLKEKGYCPGMDLVSHTEYCQGMWTVMDVLKEDKNYQLPIPTYITDAERGYRSGEVWTDEINDIAYLYIGKGKEDVDVVLNLGGGTGKRGEIQTGKINGKFQNDIFFDKRVFPR